MSKERKYVYLIGTSGGPMKIGVADDVKSRRSILNVGNPEYLRIFHIQETENDVKALERHPHYILSLDIPV